MRADSLHDKWLLASGPGNSKPKSMQKKLYDQWMTAAKAASETYRDIERFVVKLVDGKRCLQTAQNAIERER